MNNKTTATEVPALRHYDILCGRSKHCFNNIGNRRFRITVSLNVKRYDSIATRSERANFIASLAHTLKEDVGFRFLRILKNGEQVELTEEEVRAKIGHALRDLSTALRTKGTSQPPNKPTTSRRKKKAKPSNKPKTTRRKMKAAKTRSMKSTKMGRPLPIKPNIWTGASAYSQRPRFVAESMRPSLGENIRRDLNNIRTNHGQEQDWNLPMAVSAATLLPSREQGLGEFARDAAATHDDDDSLLPHQLQDELEESPMLSNLLPSSFEECSCLRVDSMPLNLSPMEEDSHPDSNVFFCNYDTKTTYSTSFPRTSQEEKIGTCSMSTDDRDEHEDKDRSVSFAYAPLQRGRVVVPYDCYLG
eukprot:scaffold25685_cov127-Cylindrotheca_fusiformis.AAC.4